MIAYAPDGLKKLSSVVASLHHELRLENHRRKTQAINVVIFGTLFVVTVFGETTFAAIMFGIIQVEVLGSVVSGAAFALLVPIVMVAAHIKLHHEADHLTKWWLKTFSSIGILLFALGISVMVGFSAWQAAEDAVSAIAAGPVGMIGGESVHSTNTSQEGAHWIGLIPNTLLFAGLSFGMIITIYAASFFLGRALQAFNILMLTPRIDPATKGSIGELQARIALLRRLIAEDASAKRRLPFDPKVKFAREAAHVCFVVGQRKLSAARRQFHPLRHNDPLSSALGDPDADSIPTHFGNEEEFCRHMADQMDVVRLHSILNVLNGAPSNGEIQ